MCEGGHTSRVACCRTLEAGVYNGAAGLDASRCDETASANSKAEQVHRELVEASNQDCVQDVSRHQRGYGRQPKAATLTHHTTPSEMPQPHPLRGCPGAQATDAPLHRFSAQDTDRGSSLPRDAPASCSPRAPAQHRAWHASEHLLIALAKTLHSQTRRINNDSSDIGCTLLMHVHSDVPPIPPADRPTLLACWQNKQACRAASGHGSYPSGMPVACGCEQSHACTATLTEKAKER